MSASDPPGPVLSHCRALAAERGACALFGVFLSESDSRAPAIMFVVWPDVYLAGAVASVPPSEAPAYLSASSGEPLSGADVAELLDSADFLGKTFSSAPHVFARRGADVAQHGPLYDIRVQFVGLEMTAPGPFLAVPTHELTVAVQARSGARRFGSAWRAAWRTPARDVLQPIAFLAAWERGPSGDPLYFADADAADAALAGLTISLRLLTVHLPTKYHTPWLLGPFAIRILPTISSQPLAISTHVPLQVSIQRTTRFPRGYLGFNKPGLNKRLNETSDPAVFGPTTLV
jgi:hypothetical protein